MEPCIVIGYSHGSATLGTVTDSRVQMTDRFSAWGIHPATTCALDVLLAARRVAAVWFVLGLVPRMAEGAEATWKAGVAKAVITPEKSRLARGLRDETSAGRKTARPVDEGPGPRGDAGRRAVLVTSDFQGVPKGMSDRVFEQLREKFGLERQQVMLTFSHNHCGPRLGDDLVDYYPVEAEQVELVNEYTALMVTHGGDGRRGARQTRPGASADRDRARRHLPSIAATTARPTCRHCWPKGKPLAGPVDHSVPVMTVTRPDGRIEAILFGYACHPTTLSFSHLVRRLSRLRPVRAGSKPSGRHGDVRQHLRRRSEPAAAPQRRALPALWPHAGRRASKRPESSRLSPCRRDLRTAFEYVELPYLKVTSREELSRPSKATTPFARAGPPACSRSSTRGEKFPPSYPYPVHAWRLGTEMLVIGMGAETVVDYALRFKAEFGPGTWVCGYADDMISYIPSRRVWEEGGYEGGSNLFEYGRPALRWAGDIEDRIAATVHKLVRQVRE